MQIVDNLNYIFSASNEIRARAKPGEILTFRTQDCFEGQIRDESQLMHDIDFDRANPTAGPVYLEGAQVGDVLVADILDIQVAQQGVACSIGGVGPLSHLADTRTRLIEIENGYGRFKDISWKLEPMLGVIGTAPAPEDGEIACGLAGKHGGNMDSKLIQKGARVYLPVRVEGGLFQLGDIHASMGDGEISGTGLEVAGEATIRLSLIKDFPLNWPVTETKDHWYVNTTAEEYGPALLEASMEMARLMKDAYAWDETDIFIYLSLQGDVGINQGVYPIHSPMITLRLGIPKNSEKPGLIK